MPVKGILFDLDDTLFDCTDQLTGPARLRASTVFQDAHPHLSLDDLSQDQARLADTLGSTGAIEEIGRAHCLPKTLVQQALEAYNRNEVEAITPFPDVPETLTKLSEQGLALALVTTGRPDRQRRKVHLLHLESYFSEQQGTLILHDYLQTPLKDDAIRQAAQNLNLPFQHLLAVGDKLDAEIAAANRLGLTTVRIRHGRQKDRSPQTLEERPDHEIDRISDLLTLLI